MVRRLLSCSAIAGWLVIRAQVACADPAAAEALFREGRALLERGELKAACEKLEASNGLEPSAGTLLNLATCRLKQGRTATAWAHFVSARRLAENQGRSQQADEARRRASELEPRLSTLTLNAPEAPPGFELRRAGERVQPGSLGSAVPVDPGRMQIELSAPGYETARVELDIGPEGEHRVLTLPALKKLAAPTALPLGRAPAAAARADADVGAPPRVVPWVIGGVGSAALLAGGVLGVMALSSNQKAEETCNGFDRARCREAQEPRDTQALASTICVGAGVVGVGVAAVWLLAGGSGRPARALTYHGEVTPHSALLQMRVGF